MWFPDGRGGSINDADCQARIAGKFTEREKQALFLTEQMEETDTLVGKGFCAAYPTHGPGSIRILANYQNILQEVPVIILFRNDQAGRGWAHIAGRILARFNPQVRLWLTEEPVADWLRKQSSDQIAQGTRSLVRVTREELHYDPRRGGVNPAFRLVNMSGTRLLSDAVGVWSDMDSDELTKAVDALETNLPMVYLDDPTLGAEWRIRDVPFRLDDEEFSEYEQRTGY